MKHNFQFECNNFVMCQERQSEEEDAEIIVKIFVEFGHPAHAKVVRCIPILSAPALHYHIQLFYLLQKGKESLHGRYFAGRTITAQIYDQMLFEEQDFSH